MQQPKRTRAHRRSRPTLETNDPAVGASATDRYHVDVISADPPGDGSVELEPESWPGALAMGRPLGSLIVNGSI